MRNWDCYSYNRFPTNENHMMKRHGTAGTLAVPFCDIREFCPSLSISSTEEVLRK